MEDMDVESSAPEGPKDIGQDSVADPKPATRFSAITGWSTDSAKAFQLHLAMEELLKEILDGAELDLEAVTDFATCCRTNRDFFMLARSVFPSLRGDPEADEAKQEGPAGVVWTGVLSTLNDLIPKAGSLTVDAHRGALTKRVVNLFSALMLEDVTKVNKATQKAVAQCVVGMYKLAGYRIDDVLTKAANAPGEITGGGTGSGGTGGKGGKPGGFKGFFDVHPEAQAELGIKESQTGVMNGGNSCYQNVVFWLLVLSSYFMKRVNDDDAFEMVDSETGLLMVPEELRPIHTRITQLLKALRVGERTNAMELLREFWQDVQDLVKNGHPEWAMFQTPGPQQDPTEFILLFLEHFLKGYMLETFGVQTTHEYRCKVCGERRNFTDPKTTVVQLIVPEKGPDSGPQTAEPDLLPLLTQSIASFEQGQMVKCSKCDKDTIHGRLDHLTSHFDLQGKPSDIIVHCIIFRHGKKLDTKVQMPTGIFLLPGPNRPYRLTYVAEHRGPRLSYGHYVCYGLGSTGRWILMNDSKSKYVSEEVMKKAQAFVVVLTPVDNNLIDAIAVRLFGADKETLVAGIEAGFREGGRDHAFTAESPSVRALSRVLHTILAELGSDVDLDPSAEVSAIYSARQLCVQAAREALQLTWTTVFDELVAETGIPPQELSEQPGVFVQTLVERITVRDRVNIVQQMRTMAHEHIRTQGAARDARLWAAFDAADLVQPSPIPSPEEGGGVLDEHAQGEEEARRKEEELRKQNELRKEEERKKDETRRKEEELKKQDGLRKEEQRRKDETRRKEEELKKQDELRKDEQRRKEQIARETKQREEAEADPEQEKAREDEQRKLREGRQKEQEAQRVREEERNAASKVAMEKQLAERAEKLALQRRNEQQQEQEQDADTEDEVYPNQEDARVAEERRKLRREADEARATDEANLAAFDEAQKRMRGELLARLASSRHEATRAAGIGGPRRSATHHDVNHGLGNFRSSSSPDQAASRPGATTEEDRARQIVGAFMAPASKAQSRLGGQVSQPTGSESQDVFEDLLAEHDSDQEVERQGTRGRDVQRSQPVDDRTVQRHRSTSTSSHTTLAQSHRRRSNVSDHDRPPPSRTLNPATNQWTTTPERRRISTVVEETESPLRHAMESPLHPTVGSPLRHAMEPPAPPAGEERPPRRQRTDEPLRGPQPTHRYARRPSPAGPALADQPFGTSIRLHGGEPARRGTYDLVSSDDDPYPVGASTNRRSSNPRRPANQFGGRWQDQRTGGRGRPHRHGFGGDATEETGVVHGRGQSLPPPRSRPSSYADPLHTVVVPFRQGHGFSASSSVPNLPRQATRSQQTLVEQPRPVPGHGIHAATQAATLSRHTTRSSDAIYPAVPSSCHTPQQDPGTHHDSQTSQQTLQQSTLPSAHPTTSPQQDPGTHHDSQTSQQTLQQSATQIPPPARARGLVKKMSTMSLRSFGGTASKVNSKVKEAIARSAQAVARKLQEDQNAQQTTQSPPLQQSSQGTPQLSDQVTTPELVQPSHGHETHVEQPHQQPQGHHLQNSYGIHHRAQTTGTNVQQPGAAGSSSHRSRRRGSSHHTSSLVDLGAAIDHETRRAQRDVWDAQEALWESQDLLNERLRRQAGMAMQENREFFGDDSDDNDEYDTWSERSLGRE
ncbi:Ubiquitin carboxyl-terminal hydrolase 3 [Elasticomyces elasticus]|nr:Ubiquitin carboxyl-terminal hydrolase 3 [Elasticomyces elasticus]